MILRRMNIQMMLDNVQMYNFVNWNPGSPELPPIINPDNPGGGNTTPVEKTEETVLENLEVEELEDGSFALDIPNDEKYTASNVKAVSFIVDYDASQVSFKGVDTIAEDAVEINDDGNGRAVIKIKDLEALKAVEAGKTLLRVIVTPKDGVKLTAADIPGIVSVKASVTTLSKNTGDTVIFVAAALVIVLAAGCAAVVYSRRKKNTIEF